MEVYTLPTRSYVNLRAFQHASALASDLFWITRRFPLEEQYALTDQLRRTARSIPRSVVQAWTKRYSGTSFRHHLNEAQSACARLALWIDLAHHSRYLTDDEYEGLMTRKKQAQRMLTRLNNNRIALLA